MTTGRHPRIPPDLAEAIDDTVDESPRVQTGRTPKFDPYFDAGKEDRRAPQNIDFDARLRLIEKHMPSIRRWARLRRWGIPSASAVGGFLVAVLVYALAFAKGQGDAAGTAREREVERQWLVDTVRALVKSDSRQQGQLEQINDRLRYPLQGPPTPPVTP